MFEAIAREPSPIRSVQEALRIIYPDAALAVDGIFGPQTRALVERFQHEHALRPSGTVDLDTWDALRKTAKQRQIFEGQAEPLRIVLQPNQVITHGSNNLLVYLLQAMLKSLSHYYGNLPEVEITGRLDAPTATAVSRFQHLCALPETGELDKNTWRYLAKHYRLAVGDGSGTYPVRVAPQAGDVVSPTP